MKTGKRFLLALLLICTGHAGAATITLVPLQPTTVVTGQTVSFDVVFDFTDVLPLGVLGGGFDIGFESGALALADVEYDFVADPAFFRPPDFLDGLIESWGVGSFTGWPATGRFGTVSWTVLPGMGSSTVIFGQRTFGIAGPWVCSIDFACFFDVTYNEVVLTRVPVPGALVLFVGALAGLTVLRGHDTRRKIVCGRDASAM